MTVLAYFEVKSTSFHVIFKGLDEEFQSQNFSQIVLTYKVCIIYLFIVFFVCFEWTTFPY